MMKEEASYKRLGGLYLVLKTRNDPYILHDTKSISKKKTVRRGRASAFV
jgi:hypothetical protein